MQIDFRDNETRRRCEDEPFARSKFPPSAVENLKLLMYKLAAYPKFEVFEKIQSLRTKYRVHPMKGKRKGLMSLSFTDKCRMTIKVYVDPKEDRITIWEVSSNHYGD